MKLSNLHQAQIYKFGTLKRKAAFAVVGGFVKLWSKVLNHVEVHHKETLYKAIEDRPRGVPLVTVCNHTSYLDEPLLWGVLKWNHLVTNHDAMRWTLAAADICFTKDWHARFFSLGKAVPVVRGDGVYQKSMDFALEKLNEGEWIHTFPEGKVNTSNEFVRLKWGVGRLIAECNVTPIVLPFWHTGMDNILPTSSPYIPRVGKKVTLLVGQPLDFTEILENLRNAKCSPREMRKSITDAIQLELYELKLQAENLQCTRSC